MNRISRELQSIASDPSEFNNFKKHIMDVCKSEIKVFQELNYFCQMNFDTLNQTIDVFDDIQAIKQMIQKMFNKVKNAKRIK